MNRFLGLGLGVVGLAVSFAGCSAGGGATFGARDGTGGALNFGDGGGPSFSDGGSVSFGNVANLPDGGLRGKNCGVLSIDTSVEEVVTKGNILVIFDQSDSMSAADFNGQVRWQAASDALVAAITPLADSLTVGAIFFPSVVGLSFAFCDPNVVSSIDDASSPNPQIPFMPGRQFLDAWAAHWARNPLVVGTPIDSGLVKGDEALASANLTGSTIVIFVTDGVPTCVIGSTSTDVPAKWAGMGIPMHVIGLPGAGAPILQGLATAGGTQKYLLPSDGAELQAEISSITSTIVKRTLNSCEIKLSEKPPGDVVLVVTEAADGKQYAVKPGADGWTLADDGSSATLNGATCTDATGGRFSNISFAFACANIPVLR